jgi:mannose-1-phosphate guanylyltransferase
MQTTNLANTAKRWAVILAGGDGARLQSLTRMISGDDRPRQFCSLFGEPTLPELTKRCIGLLFPPEQTLTIRIRPHDRFDVPLQDSQSNKFLVQPKNKETAAAIIHGLLRATQFSLEAFAALFPSDYYFSKDLKVTVVALHSDRLLVSQVSDFVWNDLGEAFRALSAIRRETGLNFALPGRRAAAVGVGTQFADPGL